MITLTAEHLTDVSLRIMLGHGIPEDEARTVAGILVEANLRGQDGHGVLMLPRYLGDVKKGRIRVPAKIVAIRDSQSSCLLDGNWGFGQVLGVKAMDTAIGKAKEHTIGLVGVKNCNHIGMLAHYTMMALEHDMIGITICNSSPEVAPYGGRARKLGTNPVSIAVPANKERPIVLDMATSVVAAGKIRAKYAKGEKTPEGWIIDNNGQPTVDPSTFLSLKGMLLPAGGYKGYGLSLVIDALCGALTGSGCCSTEFQWGNGVMMQAINIEAFTPVEAFKERIDNLVKSIKSTPTVPGVEEVLVPGEPEFRIAEERTRDGIPVDDTTWQALIQLGTEAGLNLS